MQSKTLSSLSPFFVGIFIFLVMTLNCISLILATLVMSIKKKAKLKPVPDVPPLVLWFCKRYLGRVTCTDFRSRLYEYDVCSDADENSPDFEETDETTITTLNSCHFDLYDSEDTDSMHDYNAISFSGESDLQTSGETLGVDADDYALQHGHSSQAALLGSENDKDTSKIHNKGKGVRKRASYKRAIYRNPIFSCHHSSKISSSVSSKLSAVDKEDYLRHTKLNNRRKREWYFVAETIDKSSFIAYGLSMFVTIFTVLVLVPNLQ